MYTGKLLARYAEDMKKARILIVDDHPVMRKGIRNVLSKYPELTVVEEAGNGFAAMEGAASLKPDMIIMDISMPLLDGIEATKRILDKLGAVKVIMLSMHNDRQYAVDALRAGAAGYVLKDGALNELPLALTSVLAGVRYLSPAVADALISDYISGNQPLSDPYETLSGREKEVLKLIAQGACTKDIAAALFISSSTVKKHRFNVMNKLKVDDLAGLIRLSYKKGLVKDLN